MRCSLRGVTGITGEWNERHDLVTSPVAIKCGLTVVNGDNCHQLFSAASSRLFTRANSQKMFCMFRITRRKMQCLWELLRTSNEMLSHYHWRVVWALALTIHNDDLIDADRMPGWIAINTRPLASRTFVRKHSLVTLGERIPDVIRLRGYSLVSIDLQTMQWNELTSYIAIA
jgi:hypothetical protein